jgi:Ca2+-binding EF-hand superfamily protein
VQLGLHTFYKSFLLKIGFVFAVVVSSATAQNSFASLQKTPIERQPCNLSLLEKNVRKGNFVALHDLCSLLDRPTTVADSARQILLQNTFFQDHEILFKTCTRREAMQFLNNNDGKIRYSELMHAFYLTPIEFHKPPPSIRFVFKPLGDSVRLESSRALRNFVQEFSKLLKNDDSLRLPTFIQRIADLNTREAYGWLLNVIENRTFGTRRHPIYNQIAVKLRDFPQLRTIQVLLAAHADSIFQENDIIPTLIVAANQPVRTPEVLRLMLDSLENNLDLIRYNGYMASVSVNENMFYERVHFLGKIMSDYNNLAYIRRNANLDLIATEDPRALFYTAIQLRLNPSNQILFFKRLEKMTHLQLHFVNKNNEWAAVGVRPCDDEMLKQVVQFWATHYDDFEWDKSQQYFVNKNEIATRKERYEGAFRTLNSTSDSAARAAFLLLTEGEPKEIETLANRYRGAFSQNLNSLLPSFRYSYIEQMSNLTRYCRLQQIDYTLSPELDSLKNLLLDQDLTEKERFELENLLLKKMTIDKVTALEYATLTYANDHFNDYLFSIGRILDIFYSQNWQKIVENPVQLRLYLKKTTLFRKIGLIGGICESYRRKFNYYQKNSPPSNLEKTRQLLDFLAQTEDDNDILEEIKAILNELKDDNEAAIDPNEVSYWIQQIINSPSFFDESMNIKRLSDADVQAIVNALQLERDREIVKIYFKILTQGADLVAVPHLFRIMGDGRTIERNLDNQPVTIGQKVVDVLENIYRYEFAADNPEEKLAFWRNLRDTDGENYKKWETIFFEKRIGDIEHQLNREQAISFSNMLAILDSRLYDDNRHRSLILRALPRLKPISGIKAVGQKMKLKPQTETQVFEKTNMVVRDLDKVLSAFVVEKPEDYTKMLDFMNRKIEQYRQNLFSQDSSEATHKKIYNELGGFTNDLMRNVRWFADALRAGKIPPQYRQQLADNLSIYLNSVGDILSETEYQNTQLNIVQLENVGVSTIEAIRKINQLDLSPNERQKLQSDYLARVSYRELSDVLAIADELSPEALRFVQRDFGLPLFDFDSISRKDFIQDHKKMTAFELYRRYLKRFGVDFEKNDGALDYQKIYNILKFEIVSPFAAIGGERRDYFAYGVIKLLEFEFQTLKGFHEKLNENQSTHTFNASKRALSWMQFLEKKQLVNPNIDEPPSFNQGFVSTK